jgi:hypothetical protein
MFQTKRTEKAVYWVRRWSAIQKRLCAAPNPWDNLELEDATLYVLSWLHERNKAASQAGAYSSLAKESPWLKSSRPF